MTNNLNHNLAECIKTVTQIGSNEYHNICSGTVTAIGWGLGDWAIFGFVGFAMVVVLGLVSFVFGSIIWDRW